MAVVLAAVLAVLAGCTGSPAGSPPGTVTVGTVTHTRPPTATITRTLAPGSSSAAVASSPSKARSSSRPANPDRTSAPSVTASASPPAFPSGTPTEGNCPYLQGHDVSLLSGQRVGRVELIAAAPQPICVFYRIVDGGWLGAVRVIDADSPAQAVAAVDAAAPPADSSPADQPAGWGGGYLLLPRGDAHFPESRALYAVSKGKRAVIAWNSRDQTVKSRRLVEATITALHW